MRRFLEQALELANESSHSFRHGAIVVKDGRILSQGNNKYKANRMKISTRNHRCSMHAEEAALRQCSKNECVHGTIYVARVASYGRADSKPCDRCQKILKSFGICKAVYTTPEGSDVMLLQ